jgi:thiol-disulfide isomerase/thioredoxin
MLSAAGTACAGGACAVGATAAAPAAAGVLGGLSAQLAAALGALGLSAGVAFAGGGDELAAMARDGMDLQTAFGASRPVVLEFYSKDCAHCRESSKRLHEVERAHPEVSWVMVDTQDESNRVLWERLGVDEIPHFAFLDAGKELRRTEVGPISTDRAEAGIRSVVIPGM